MLILTNDIEISLNKPVRSHIPIVCMPLLDCIFLLKISLCFVTLPINRRFKLSG